MSLQFEPNLDSDASPGTSGGVSSILIPAILESAQELIEPGSLTTGTSQGSTAELPGDLGSLFSDDDQQSLISTALRRSAAENFFRPRNHRYRGVREAWKFNLAMQQLMALVAYTFTILKTKYAALKVTETTIMPTTTELAVIYHCREQLRFQEWIVQKDDDKEWFE